MRRLAYISLTISGSVLLVFLVNILLFSYVPAYHEALETAVAGDSEIPMVVIDENNEAVVIRRDEMLPENRKASKAFNVLETTEIETDDSVPLSGTIDADVEDLEKEIVSRHQDTDQKGQEDCIEEDGKIQEKSEKRIVDKKYYEDCGSDKGYWVITYEDGTTSIEK